MKGKSVEEAVNVAEGIRPPPTIYDPLLQGPAWFITHPATTAVKTEPVKQEPLEVPTSVFCSVSPPTSPPFCTESDDPLSCTKKVFKLDLSPCKIEIPRGETDEPCRTQLQDLAATNEPCNSPPSFCLDSPRQDDADFPPPSPSAESQMLPVPDFPLPLEEPHRPSLSPSPNSSSSNLPATTSPDSTETGTCESIQPSSFPVTTIMVVPRIIPDTVQRKPSEVSLQPCYVRLERLTEAFNVRRGRSTARTKKSIDGRTARRDTLLRSTSRKDPPGRNCDPVVIPWQTTLGRASSLSSDLIPDQSRPSSISNHKVVKDDIRSIVRLKLVKIPGSQHPASNTRDGSPMGVSVESNRPTDVLADCEGSDKAKPVNATANCFQCATCPRAYKTKGHLRRHLYTHGGLTVPKVKKPLICKVCSTTFKKKSYLNVHVCEHNIFKGYKCGTCGKVLKTRCSFSAHTKNHMIALMLPKVFSCAICQRKYEKQTSLTSHMQVHKNLNYFECATCFQVLKHKKNLTNHVLAHIVPKPARVFTCVKCSKGFKVKANLAIHMRMHTEYRPFPCVDCDKTFKSSGELKNHIVVHKPDKPFPCKICNKRFRRMNDVKKHELVMHLSVATVPDYPCPTCGKLFKNEWMLKSHLPTHETRREFVCKECSKGFKTKWSLKFHMISHGEARPYKCNRCDKAFKTSGDCKKHSLVHETERRLACDICSKTFKYRLSLKFHVATHVDDYPFACTKCPLRFKVSTALRLHMVRHNSKKGFTCHLCTRSFHAKGDLARHVPLCLTKPFKCRPCGLSFRTAERFDNHVQTHEKKKPKPPELSSACDECGKRFADESKLKHHRQTVHSDKRPYSCKTCDKSYKSQGSLKRHTVIAHQ